MMKKYFFFGIKLTESQRGTYYLCRVRVGANAAERTPCASRMGALEKSIRSYPDTRGEHVVEPLNQRYV
jgi:hypothetical protein